MLRFQDIPIKNKLTTIILLTCSLVIFMASVVYIINELYSFKRNLIHNISTLAEVTAINSTAALSFNDPKTGEEILTALSVEPYVLIANIYTVNENIFASYSNIIKKRPDSLDYSQNIPTNYLEAKKIYDSSRESYRFSKKYLDFVTPIILNEKEIGNIFIRADLEGLYSNLRWLACISICVLLGSILLAYVISVRFQRLISKPISNLAETMKIVSSKKEYTVRAEKSSNDELGILIEGFNEMLAQIQMRDEKLEGHKDQLEAQVELRTTEILNANRDLEDMVLKLRKAKEETDAAAKIKSEFLANMSHEIRTPMNAIIGMTDMVTHTSLNRKQKDYINIIRSSAKSLLQLINDILDFSKMESGKLEFDIIPVLIRDVVEEIPDMFLDKIREKEIELILDITSDVPREVFADPLRLRQVLVNLISNAFKFTNSGEICIEIRTLSRKDDMIELLFAVRDTGVGLEPEIKDKIFGAFSQVDGSTTRKYGGTGLGLFICKEIVNMMNGAIWVESTPGRGSSFCFSAEFRYVIDKSEKKYVFPSNIKNLRILVVEDNITTQIVIKRMLQSLGLRVEVADNADIALSIYEKTVHNDPIDLILMDIILPGTDGITVAEKIKKHDKIKPPPIIMMSSSYRNENIVRIKDAGIESFMMKPLKQSEMFDSIMEVFGYEPSLSEKVTEGLSDPEEFSNICVLLVEDNPINQMVAMEILAMVNISVVKAGNGVEAIELTKEMEFDAVLMDIQMPVMDGMEATRKLRKEFDKKKLPIIAMTANAMKGDRERCLDVGMNDYISKPIDSKELFSALRRNIMPLKDLNVKEAIGSECNLSLPSSLPGLDIEVGVKRMAGNRPFYFKVLREFSRDYADATDRIRDALAANDIELASRLSHTIKGLAGNCSAAELQLSAQKLESAIKENEKDEYENLLNNFDINLKHVMELIAELKDDSEKETSMSLPHYEPVNNIREKIDSSTEELLIEMSGYLKKRKNAKAEECMELVEEKLKGAGFGNEGIKMRSLVDMMDYNAALELLIDISEKMDVRIT